MESIIHNVRDLAADQRESLETVVGHELRDDQQVMIRVLTTGLEPDSQTKHRALTDLKRLSEQGAGHRAALGVSEAEADRIVDEAAEQIRQRKSP